MVDPLWWCTHCTENALKIEKKLPFFYHFLPVIFSKFTGKNGKWIFGKMENPSDVTEK